MLDNKWESLVVGRKNRGKPKRRWRDNLRVIGVQEENAGIDRAGDRKSALATPPSGTQAIGRERFIILFI